MTPDQAKREYAGVWAEHIRTGRFLRICVGALLVVSTLLAISLYNSTGRVLKPLIVRVDEVGRAQAVQYEAMELEAEPQAPATLYFLRQFVSDHFSRRRDTVVENWPRSLMFLSAELATAARAEQTAAVAEIAAGSSDSDHDVEDIVLRRIPRPELPYEMIAEYDVVERIAEQEVARRRYTTVLRYVFISPPPRELYSVNPIGLIFTYLSTAEVE